jgi:hypothetical protein
MKTRDQLALLGGVGLGAGLMYLLDPEGGRRRRALARDKAVHGLKVSGKALRGKSTDLGNRTRGLVAKTRARLRPEVHESTELQGERRLSPRKAALGLGSIGGIGALAGLGLLARSAKGKKSGQQLEW